MILSIFYIIAYLILFLSIILIKKNDDKENLFVWIALSIITTFCYQAFIGAIFWKIGVPVSILTIGIADLIAGIALLSIAYKKGLQKLDMAIIDVIALIVIAMLSGYYMVRNFGLLTDINFVSIDSAVHMDFARTIATEHRIPSTMFFAAINTGLPMEVFLPFIREFNLYKIFILWETGYFFLSGFMFYILIRPYMKSKGLKVVGLVGVIVYMTGYPLYSYLFGFSYFGLSISLIAYIIYMAILYISHQVSAWLNYIMLGLGLFGLFLCYMLFVPIVYPGVLVAIIIGIKCTEKLISFRTIGKLLGVFLVPSAFGLFLTFYNLFYLSPAVGNSNSGGGSAGIASDGGCYNDLYSNFVMMMPFLISGIIIAAGNIKKLKLANKQKSESEDTKSKNSCDFITAEHMVLLSLTICLGLVMVLFFVMAMHGRVSVYYYVRNNNVLALLAMVLSFISIEQLYKKSKTFVISGCLVIILALGMIKGNVDYRIGQKNDRFIRVGVEQLFDIYSFNHDFVRFACYINGEDIGLYDYMEKTQVNEDTESPEVMVVGPETYTWWFKVMTKHKSVKQINDYNTFVNTDLNGYKYICVQKTDIYDEGTDSFDNLGNIIFDNKRGMIIELTNEGN